MKRDDSQNPPEADAAGQQDAPRPNPQPASQQDDKPRAPDAAQGYGADGASQQQGPSMEDFSKLMVQLDQATAEAADFKDRLIRSVADFDNFRRRTTREKEDIRRFASAALVEDLLPVIDNMALALDSARKHHPEASGVIDGVDMIYSQFRNVLKNHGVEEVAPQGQPFDPNLHESIAHQASAEVPEGSVLAVTRTGYTLNGRLIRPATVVLSAGPQKQED